MQLMIFELSFYHMTTKEQFLTEHNKLSPLNLKATMEMLLCFKSEKQVLFKSDDWPIDKIRRPFIFWLTSMARVKKIGRTQKFF
jgi:hypothetical protein